MQFVFDYKPLFPEEHFLKNIALVKALNLPKPENKERPPLAIVGGGPSVLKYIEKLKTFPGDVWACGSAFPWARDQGIKATFFNIDPLPEQAEYAKGAEHAILSTMTHISVFDVVPNIECFDLVTTADYSNQVVTAVTSTPILAMEMGYMAVFYLGCEGSFDKTTHAYDYTNTNAPEMGIWVLVGDDVYPSSPQYLLQTRFMADILRTCPKIFREFSGGLLRALVAEPEYEIIAVDKMTHDMMEFTLPNGDAISRELAREVLPILDMRR